MDISFLVSVFNAETTIEKCLSSIISGAEKSFMSYEIIVIDDGSTDSTYYRIRKLAESFTTIKIYTQENSGSAYSRNRALNLAVGEYVFFVDSDDYVNSSLILEELNSSRSLNLDAIRGGWKSLSKDESYLPNETFRYLLDSDEIKMKFFWEMGFWRYVYRREFLIARQIIFTPTFKEMKYPFVLDDFFFLLTFIANQPLILDTDSIFYYYNDGRDQTDYFSRQISLQASAIQKYLKSLQINEDLNYDFIFKILKYRVFTSYKRSTKSISLLMNTFFALIKIVLKLKYTKIIKHCRLVR